MFYPLFKRAIDFVVAIIGLVFCSVIYIPVAIAIKLDSNGPVIFGQERVGQKRRVFTCYKFRTMYTTVSDNKYKPTISDERVTRAGRILRRWSLDELPQFWNILRGDMSLVGPRPELDEFVSNYEDWQYRRFETKPGLTGWWQVNGRKQPMYDYIHEDIYYVDHQSMLLDIKIILRTLAAIFSGRGAI